MSSGLPFPAGNARSWGLSLCHIWEENSMDYGHPPDPFVSAPFCKWIKGAGRNNGECRDEISSLRREKWGLVSRHGCVVSSREGARTLTLIVLEPSGDFRGTYLLSIFRFFCPGRASTSGWGMAVPLSTPYLFHSRHLFVALPSLISSHFLQFKAHGAW